jgi:hypothetical protein
VQGKEARNHPHPKRHGLSQVPSRVRIEEAMLAVAAALEVNANGQFGVRRPAVHRDGFPPPQAFFGQHTQHPQENLVICFHIDQTARS